MVRTGLEPYRHYQPATVVTKAQLRNYPVDWVQVAAQAVAAVTAATAAMALARLVRPIHPAALFIRIPTAIRSFPATSKTISHYEKPVRSSTFSTHSPINQLTHQSSVKKTFDKCPYLFHVPVSMVHLIVFCTQYWNGLKFYWDDAIKCWWKLMKI